MLALSNVEVVYSDVIVALRGVSLEVPDRSIVALLGANGAGKTTALRAISGLLDVHRGQIRKGSVTLDGDRIDGLDSAAIVRRGVAQVLEGRRIFAELTVDENLKAGAFLRRDGSAVRRSHDRVMELFPVLRERKSQTAGYLSGGEQQMLAIGRALMADPKLLLLDEPSTAKKSALAPELPTVAESGLPGFDISTWFGIFAPAGTPKPALDRLHAEFTKALAAPDVREKMTNLGAEPVGNSPEEFAAYIKAEAEKYAKVIKASGAKVD